MTIGFTILLRRSANFIQTIQQRQGLQVACPEEVAFRKGWIGVSDLEKLAAPLAKTEYGQYLLTIAHDGPGR